VSRKQGSDPGPHCRRCVSPLRGTSSAPRRLQGHLATFLAPFVRSATSASCTSIRRDAPGERMLAHASSLASGGSRRLSSDYKSFRSSCMRTNPQFSQIQTTGRNSSMPSVAFAIARTARPVSPVSTHLVASHIGQFARAPFFSKPAMISRPSTADLPKDIAGDAPPPR